MKQAAVFIHQRSGDNCARLRERKTDGPRARRPATGRSAPFSCFLNNELPRGAEEECGNRQKRRRFPAESFDARETVQNAAGRVVARGPLFLGQFDRRCPGVRAYVCAAEPVSTDGTFTAACLFSGFARARTRGPAGRVIYTGYAVKRTPRPLRKFPRLARTTGEALSGASCLPSRNDTLHDTLLDVSSTRAI